MHILRLDNVMKLEQIHPLNKTSQLITRILKMCGQGLRREHGNIACANFAHTHTHTHTEFVCPNTTFLIII